MFADKRNAVNRTCGSLYAKSFRRNVLSCSYQNCLLLWRVSKRIWWVPSNVELIEGFPNDVNELTRGHDNSLIVLDDLMTQCSNDPCVADLFTRGSHHRGLISARQIISNHQYKLTLHADISEPQRFTWCCDIGTTDVSQECRLLTRIILRC